MTSDDSLSRRCLAECIGTFMLVFVGTAAIVVNATTPGVVSHLGISLAFGLVVLVAIYAFGDISGAHINPAVSIAFWIARRLSGYVVLPYIAAQMLGACLASVLVMLIFPDAPTLGETLPSAGHARSFLIEVVITFMLMLVILRVSHGAKEQGIPAGIVVGSMVALMALVAGPMTGASMNPARTFGPALVGGNFEGIWIYMVATLLGAALAVSAHCCLTGQSCCPSDTSCEVE